MGRFYGKTLSRRVEFMIKAGLDGIRMAEKLDAKETVSFEELLMSNVYTQEALINLLDSKGIISKADK
jgi:hypothetical protein